MTAYTKYTGPVNPTAETTAAFTAKLTQMATDGKTDKAKYLGVSGYPDTIIPGSQIIRAFTDLSAAQEFGTFALANGASDITYYDQAS